MAIKSGVITLLLVLLIGSAAAERSVELSVLQLVEGRWIVAGEPEPFTGTALDSYADGAVKAEIQYRNGLRHGKDIGWYPNGELKHVVRYKKGEPQSRGSSWHSQTKTAPEPLDFALCSEHPELNSVCGEADTNDASHFESCANKRC
jgi:hypothetical protein